MNELSLRSRYMSSNSPSDEPLYTRPTAPHPPRLCLGVPLTPHPLTDTNHTPLFQNPPVTFYLPPSKNIFCKIFKVDTRDFFFTIISVFFTIPSPSIVFSHANTNPTPRLITTKTLHIQKVFHLKQCSPTLPPKNL